MDKIQVRAADETNVKTEFTFTDDAKSKLGTSIVSKEVHYFVTLAYNVKFLVDKKGERIESTKKLDTLFVRFLKIPLVMINEFIKELKTIADCFGYTSKSYTDYMPPDSWFTCGQVIRFYYNDDLFYVELTDKNKKFGDENYIMYIKFDINQFRDFISSIEICRENIIKYVNGDRR